MPCGGISSLVPGSFTSEYFDELVAKKDESATCFHCDQPITTPLFVEEWDCYIERTHLGAFLITDEGLVVMAHGHQIYLREI